MVDIGLAGAFIGGLLSLLSPCSVMLLPAFFAYAFGSGRRIIARTGVFYLGLITSLVPMGVLAASVGQFLLTERDTLVRVVGIAVLIAGVLLLLGVGIPMPAVIRVRPDRNATSVVSTFLLGAVYAIAGVCAGPLLGSVLLVASLGTLFYGAILMALYAAGMTLPLLVLALIWGRLGDRGMVWLRPRMVEATIAGHHWQNSWSTAISGVLTIGVGVLLLVSDGTAGIGGFLGVGEQARLETAALGLSTGIPDGVIVFAAMAAIAALILVRNREQEED